ncbi:MAG: site-specific DNA-methyltransferase, partial [Phycisphaeraceae bacterium]|nr:site-specific DNA-methyltransferase [Phycisphaeraceae bacterium]
MTELPQRHVEMLSSIKAADAEITRRFADKMRINDDLDRTLVSFQANKTEIGHRWCKYREGFSAELIRYLIEKTRPSGTILDPFAGSGTSLFVAAELGLSAIGIELLPCSVEIMKVRRAVFRADQVSLAKSIRDVMAKRAWDQDGEENPFPHLRITQGAFPLETQRRLGRFLHVAGQTEDAMLSELLRFAAMSVLEEISFTRKDGQYLRWDQRSGRGLGKKSFDKGTISGFDEAILRKLTQIVEDVEGRNDEPMLFTHDAEAPTPGNIEITTGSCLDIVPSMKAESIGGLITSPPYCNRYDYTRTYALELAMLNVGEEGIRRLRQAMLSCTVENKDKHDLAGKF